MPTRPPRTCPTPGCTGLWNGTSCTKCKRTARTTGWKSDKQRGTRTARGYDNRWLRLRAAKLRDSPCCEECERQGRDTAAKQVHHIRGFNGRDDPKRLNWENLQSLCAGCHAKKSGGQR